MERLVQLINRADEYDISDGKKAYIRYHDVLMGLAHFYRYPFPNVVAAFCALSPNNDYYGNLRSVVSVMHYCNEGLETHDIPVSTYGHCRDRAVDYLHGAEFLTKSRGLKISNFYRNIVDPTDDEPVTVDGHMYRAWSGTAGGMKGVAMNKTMYNEIASDIRKVARLSGLLPNQAQAIMWYARKRLLSIVYTDQLDLLGTGGFQRATFSPAELQPYKVKGI